MAEFANFIFFFIIYQYKYSKVSLPLSTTNSMQVHTALLSAQNQDNFRLLRGEFLDYRNYRSIYYTMRGTEKGHAYLSQIRIEEELKLAATKLLRVLEYYFAKLQTCLHPIKCELVILHRKDLINNWMNLVRFHKM